MIKLKDIRDYMMNSMSHYNPRNNGEYYDEDGHCSDGLWLQIQEFWNNFNTDADFKYLVSCEWASDELDLEGGRSYLLDDKLVDMCFDYMYNTLGWSLSDYQKMIHNTLDFSEEIEEKYDNISTKRDEKLTSIISETSSPVTKMNKNIWDSISFEAEDFDYIPHVVKYHISRRTELDNCDSLEFLSKSLVDDNFVCYKIKSLGVKIPKGYEIVKPC
jgi:hypothetical protein